MCWIRMYFLSMATIALPVLSSSCTADIEDLAKDNENNISEELQRATEVEKHLLEQLNNALGRIKSLENELEEIKSEVQLNADNQAGFLPAIEQLQTKAEQAVRERETINGKVEDLELDVSKHDKKISDLEPVVMISAGKIESNDEKIEHTGDMLDTLWMFFDLNKIVTEANSASIVDHTTQLAEIGVRLDSLSAGILQVLDGAGVELGKVIAMDLYRVFYFDERFSMPVEAPLDTLAGDNGFMLYYDTPDCSGVAYVDYNHATKNHAYLDQATGKVFVWDGSGSVMKVFQSYRSAGGQVACETTVWSEESVPLAEIGVYEAFTPGITIAPVE